MFVKSFRGPVSEREAVARGVQYVLGRCNTQVRYIDPDQTLSPGEFPSRAATACLFDNGVDASEIDLFDLWRDCPGELRARDRGRGSGTPGGEATARVRRDLCLSGLIEAIHVVAGYFALHPHLKTALVCAGELWRDHVTYDLQTLDDVANFAAGLTLGNAAAAFL